MGRLHSDCFLKVQSGFCVGNSVEGLGVRTSRLSFLQCLLYAIRVSLLTISVIWLNSVIN